MLQMDPIGILSRHQKLIYPEIKKYLESPKFPKAFAIPAQYRHEENFHWKVTRDYPERKGKYLRPTLLVLTAQSMGVDIKKTIKSASAMQLSEDWLLIHDDIQDNSVKRRGLPSLHRIYGPEMAINAGDSLHVIMWKIFLDTKEILGEKTTFRLMDEFYVQLSRTVMGQMTEIRWVKQNKKSFSDMDWYFIADGKTCYYTIACPMRLGAIIAGADKKQLDKLADFGILLGRCFQLVDDILDVTSDFSGLKEMGNDIFEGKRTIILGHLMKKINNKDRERLTSILKKKREDKTKKDVYWVISVMKQYGSIEYAKNLALEYKNKAKKMFNDDLAFLSRQPYRNELSTLIDFILERRH